jgi:hypothetical protein
MLPKSTVSIVFENSKLSRPQNTQKKHWSLVTVKKKKKSKKSWKKRNGNSLL